MQELEHDRHCDVYKNFAMVRQDRGGMVQTKDQYKFIYQVQELNGCDGVHASCSVLLNLSGGPSGAPLVGELGRVMGWGEYFAQIQPSSWPPASSMHAL